VTERPIPSPLLLNAVRGSLRPVRPYLPAPLRALALLPVGIVLVVGIPALWTPRPNLALLGNFAGWGLSALQMLLGLGLVGLALHDAVPGQELSRRALAAVILLGVLLFLALTVTSEWLAPVPLRRRVWVHEAIGCFRMAATWGVPAFAIAAGLSLRASPTRPLVASAVCGLGTGLMTDAGMRLFCGVSTISHVLVGHGAAILLLAVLGALVGAVADRLPRLPTRGSFLGRSDGA
jgi:hypothetical protein